MSQKLAIVAFFSLSVRLKILLYECIAGSCVSSDCKISLRLAEIAVKELPFFCEIFFKFIWIAASSLIALNILSERTGLWKFQWQESY